MERRHVTVYGFVQGVGFRFAVERAARSRGVTGWVRNRPDGTVEAVFEGDLDDVEVESPEGLAGFRVAM